MRRLGRAQVLRALRDLPGWEHLPGRPAIRKRIRTGGFARAVRLIGRIARLAERTDHHPDIHLTRYRRLEVRYTTHDAGGITRKDIAAAAAVERLLSGEAGA